MAVIENKNDSVSLLLGLNVVEMAQIYAVL